MKSHSQEAADRFDRWATMYGEDRLTAWFRHYQSLALSKLPIERGSGFLEVGCATGWAVRKASERLNSGMCCGIDVSPKMVDKARSLSQEFPNVEYELCVAESIRYADDTFHSVLCTNAFHHFEHPVQALLEIRRVTRPRGRFVLMDSARDVSIAIWLQDRWRRYLEQSHVRYYTTTELRDLLAAAGWSLVEDILTIRAFRSQGKLFTGLALAVCEK